MDKMRAGAILFFLVFALSTAYGQSDSLPPFSPKKGIYLSFQDLANDRPSRTDSFRIVTRSKSNLMLGGGPQTFVLDSAKNNEFKVIRRTMIGVSDGSQFFISDRYTFGGWMGMSPCLMKGPYIWANVPGLYAGKGYIIDIRTGAHQALNKKSLLNLMQKHPDLVNEYNNKEIMDHVTGILNTLNDLERK